MNWQNIQFMSGWHFKMVILSHFMTNEFYTEKIKLKDILVHEL